MKKILMGVCGALLLSQASFAVDLMTVYQQALNSDPVFKQALATYQAAMESVPQAVAILLPQLALSGQAAAEKDIRTGTAGINTTERSLGFGLSLTQSIFNFADWMALASANYSVKAAQATYSAAAQDLMIRTATAYFNVLETQEILKYNEANKNAYYQQYEQAEASYEVGIKAITDVYNAKASYDGAVASYIGAKNDVDNAKENLREITGEYYSQFSILEKSLPLIVPAPQDIDQWVAVANQQNWDLIASRYSVLSAQETLRQQKAGHLPTVNFESNYDNTNTTNLSGETSSRALGAGRTKALSGQIDLALPIFSGGMTSSQVRQALANYDLAAEKREKSARDTVNNTRKAYLAIVSGIKTVQADQQAIQSNESSLEGTKEGYKVGTRTMVDVLLAQSDLFNAYQQFAKDRYAYVINLLTLKQASGTLSDQDLMAINQWLQESPIVQTPAVKAAPIKVVQKPVVKETAPKPEVKTVAQGNVEQKPVEKQSGIYLQTGAFSQEENAEQSKMQVKQFTTQTVFVKKEGLYKVKIGPIYDKKTAWEISRSLQQAGYPKPIVTNE